MSIDHIVGTGRAFAALYGDGSVVTSYEAATGRQTALPWRTVHKHSPATFFMPPLSLQTLRLPTSDLSWKPSPEDVISMFPFLALSVFNFYVSMSELFMQDMSKTEPKVGPVNDLRSKRLGPLILLENFSDLFRGSLWLY